MSITEQNVHQDQTVWPSGKGLSHQIIKNIFTIPGGLRAVSSIFYFVRSWNTIFQKMLVEWFLRELECESKLKENRFHLLPDKVCIGVCSDILLLGPRLLWFLLILSSSWPCYLVYLSIRSIKSTDLCLARTWGYSIYKTQTRFPSSSWGRRPNRKQTIK